MLTILKITLFIGSVLIVCGLLQVADYAFDRIMHLHYHESIDYYFEASTRLSVPAALLAATMPLIGIFRFYRVGRAVTSVAAVVCGGLLLTQLCCCGIAFFDVLAKASPGSSFQSITKMSPPALALILSGLCVSAYSFSKLEKKSANEHYSIAQVFSWGALILIVGLVIWVIGAGTALQPVAFSVAGGYLLIAYGILAYVFKEGAMPWPIIAASIALCCLTPLIRVVGAFWHWLPMLTAN